MDTQAALAKTPLYFQRALVEEIRELTQEMLFSVPGSEELKKIQVFAQSLPIPARNRDGAETHNTIDYGTGGRESPVFACPWCIVKLEHGAIPAINEMQHIEVAICFGIYNPDSENKGHEELLNLIQMVYQRFACDPLLDRQFTCRGEFEWALQEEDTHPYFFGAIGTTFKFMGYRREMKF